MAKRFQTLNIGAATVELAEYEAGAKGALTLVNYGTAQLAAPVDPESASMVLAPAIGEILSTSGMRPGKVALSVSGQMAFQRFAAIPAAGGEERFEQMVRYEIEQNVPFPVDEMICDRQVLGDTEAGDKSVMIVAAKTDQIEAVASAVQSLGFSLEIVGIAPIALTNAVRSAVGDDGSCAVILDIGAKTTSLVIVEGDKIYNRSIPVAGNAITKEISSALGCSLEEAEQLKVERGYVSMGGVTEDEDETADRVAKVCRAVLTRLVAEISRSVNFYRSQQGGSAPAALYLTGGTALLPQIDVFLSEALSMDVAFFNPFEAIAVGNKVDTAALEADGALISSTAGLALQLAGNARFVINLLPPSILSDRAEKAKIPFVAAAGVALVAGLVLTMLSFDNGAKALVARRDVAAAEASKLDGFAKKVKAAEERLSAEHEQAESFRTLLMKRASAAQRLSAVRDSLVPGMGMWVEKWENGRITIRYWKDRVKDAGGKTPGERVVESLKHKAVVVPESVRISDMSAIGKDGQVTQFTVEVAFK